jgi:hypothetical protein
MPVFGLPDRHEPALVWVYYRDQGRHGDHCALSTPQPDGAAIAGALVAFLSHARTLSRKHASTLYNPATH